MITLTPLGKHQAEQQTTKGPKAAVLSLLYESDAPMEVEEVMEATRMEDEKALMIVRALINQGYVKEV